MIAASDDMQRVFELVRRVASSEISVLIRGESGTGKELVARALHDLSPRAKGPFRAVNCATLTGDLLASELFGHVRGAFTGAHRDRKGLFEQAEGGTLFLDEIAEIPLHIQPRLLRVLQTKQFTPVGGTEARSVKVRVLTATHRALRRAVARGTFRADLMYRIRVRPLYLPPLRDRHEDVSALLWHFIDQFNAKGGRSIESVEAMVMDALWSYPWPGNVRELRNAVEGCYAFGVGPVLTWDELTDELRGEPPPLEDLPGSRTLEEQQRHQLLKALGDAGGHRGKAAKSLGVSRTTLWRRMRELKL
jgi:two-component system response regulator AtoC